MELATGVPNRTIPGLDGHLETRHHWHSATIAKQERIRLSERVKAGLERARRAGKTLGGPRCVIDVEKVRALRAAGKSWDDIGNQTGTSARTCKRRLAGLI